MQIIQCRLCDVVGWLSLRLLWQMADLPPVLGDLRWVRPLVVDRPF